MFLTYSPMIGFVKFKNDGTIRIADIRVENAAPINPK